MTQEVIDFLKWFIQRFDDQANVMNSLNLLDQKITQIGENMPRKEDLTALQATLEGNNAIIAELAGDIEELATSNEQQIVQLTELKDQIAILNDPSLDAMITNSLNIAKTQAETLRSAADVVPEAAEPEEPTEPTV